MKKFSFFRGVYLASILYKEDKVLCTVDDAIPIIQIDENTPATLSADFNWFMKVLKLYPNNIYGISKLNFMLQISCAWEDSKRLHCDLGQSSPSVQFRSKLLEAASHMQAALGIQDLGRLHSRPITDSFGTTLLVTIQYVTDTKSVQVLNKHLMLNFIL